MRSTIFHYAIPGVLLAGCATNDHHSGGGELQMNDLSVMLPLAHSQAELDAALTPIGTARGGVLLPQAIYSQDTHSGGIPYDQLRVVAFRFDPCFGQVDAGFDPSKCENQLRLVFQPLTFDTVNNVAVAQDSAVHVFYKLTREELLAAVDEMIAARLADGNDTDLGPLAPHPVVASEGLAGPLAQRFNTILTKYAGAQNLERITSFEVELIEGGANIVGGDQFWTLHGNDFANGQATPMQIASLPPSTTELGLDVNANPLFTNFSPATTSTDNIGLIANFGQAMMATPAERQASYDSALRIENPHFHSPNTIDCASCHMAQPSRQLVGDALGMKEAGNANAYVPDAAIPVADLAATTHLLGNDGGLNIHAFSYRTSEPMINQRVINETAANLKFIAGLR